MIDVQFLQEVFVHRWPQANDLRPAERHTGAPHYNRMNMHELLAH